MKAQKVIKEALKENHCESEPCLTFSWFYPGIADGQSEHQVQRLHPHKRTDIRPHPPRRRRVRDGRPRRRRGRRRRFNHARLHDEQQRRQRGALGVPRRAVVRGTPTPRQQQPPAAVPLLHDDVEHDAHAAADDELGGGRGGDPRVRRRRGGGRDARQHGEPRVHEYREEQQLLGSWLFFGERSLR